VPLPTDQPCIGISSFGFGGSNAHAVIERHDREPLAPEPDLPMLLALSSHTADGLAGDARRLASFLTRSDAPLADVAFSLQAGRDPLRNRRAHVVRDRAQAIAALGAEDDARGAWSSGTGKPVVAFVFTGQGAQYAGMGRELHERVAPFRDAFDACDRLIAARAGLSIGELLYRSDADDLLLEDTGLAQLALFALEHALASVWLAAGVRPAFAIGHSIGELVAHTVGGALSLGDAVALVHERGRLMQGAAHDGAMTTASMDADAARARYEALGLPLHIAAVNGARRVVVSGDREAIAAFTRDLEASGVACRPLRTRHAFHTPFFAAAAAELAARSAALPVGEGRIPVASNLDGGLVPAGSLGADYWARHITMPVEFARGVRTLVERGADLFLEIGPDRVLSRVIAADHRAVGTVSSLERGRDAEEALLRAAGALHRAGVDLDLTALGGLGGSITSIPPRGLARRRYWTEAGEAPAAERPAPRAPSAAPTPPMSIDPIAPASDEPDDSLHAVIARQLELMSAQLRLLGDP
jgi:acyl transferase domain-containing protein